MLGLRTLNLGTMQKKHFGQLIFLMLASLGSVDATMYADFEILGIGPLGFDAANGHVVGSTTFRVDSTADVLVFATFFSPQVGIETPPQCDPNSYCSSNVQGIVVLSDAFGPIFSTYSEFGVFCSGLGDCVSHYAPFTYNGLSGFGELFLQPGLYSTVLAISSSTNQLDSATSNNILAFSVAPLSGVVSSTPEPASLASFGSGLAALFWIWFRRKSPPVSAVAASIRTIARSI